MWCRYFEFDATCCFMSAMCQWSGRYPYWYACDCIYVAVVTNILFLQVWSYTGSLTCSSCTAGYFSVNGSACAACPAGSTSMAGASQCTPCPMGTSQGQVGQVWTNACLVYLRKIEQLSHCCRARVDFIQSQCLVCASGTFASAVGSAICTPCDTGYYSQLSTLGGNVGPTVCTACAPGSFNMVCCGLRIGFMFEY